MNYLSLVKRAIKESGAHLSMPVTVGASEGMIENFENWIADAWKEIQLERPDWQFNREEIRPAIVLDIAEGGRALIPASTIGLEHRNNWRIIALREVWLSEVGTAEGDGGDGLIPIEEIPG